jgi:twitching motility protein PilT
MVRADGDALVMHVGERPIVVSGSRTIDLSAHGMNLSAMVGMLGQLLSGEALSALQELGAVEHALPARGQDRFSVVAARSGDDIWIEIRRRREGADAGFSEPADAPASAHQAEAPAAEAAADEAASAEAVAAADASAEPVGRDVQHDEPAAVAADTSEPAHPVEIAQPAAEDTADAASEAAAAAPSDPEPLPVEVSEAAYEASATVAEIEPSDEPETVQAAGLDEPSEPEPYELIAVSEPTPMPELAASVAAAPPAESAEAAPDAPVEDEPSEPVTQPEIALQAEQVESQQAEPAWSAASVSTDSPAHVEDASPQLTVLAASGLSATTTPVAAASQVMPMEPVRHSGPPADMPPPRPTLPTTPAAEPAAENGAGVPEAPVTRTVRIEVPARAVPSSRAAGIDRLLRAADAVGASELFVMSQARPYVRVGGHVRPLQEEGSLLGADVESLVADVTPEPWRDAVRRGDPAEWLIELADVGRVRCSTFRDHRGPGANFHFAFLRATTADDLRLSDDMRLLATEPDGLVLVAGAASQDAAAIVAAFVGILNEQRADYIITLEPSIRVSHPSRSALVSQREVGHDGPRALAAARAALREEPDVLVIEGISTGDMAQLAIEAAAQERLVIASIDAASGVAAVQRLVDLVPAEQRQAARATLARCFRGAVAQLPLRKVAGGRIAARELLSGTRAVADILANGDLARLAELLEAPGAAGMAPLADAIVEYVRLGLVDVREAARKAPDLDRLLTRLKDAGVDVKSVEERS